MLTSAKSLTTSLFVWISALVVYFNLGVGPHPANEPLVALLLWWWPAIVLLEIAGRMLLTPARRGILYALYFIPALTFYGHFFKYYQIPQIESFLIGYAIGCGILILITELILARRNPDSYIRRWVEMWSRIVENPQPIIWRVVVLAGILVGLAVVMNPAWLIPAMALVPLTLMMNRVFSWLVVIFYLYETVGLSEANIMRAKDRETGNSMSPQRIHWVGIPVMAYEQMRRWKLQNHLYPANSNFARRIVLLMQLCLFFAFSYALLSQSPSWFHAPLSWETISWIGTAYVLSLFIGPTIYIGFLVFLGPVWFGLPLYLAWWFTQDPWVFGLYPLSLIFWADHIISTKFGTTIGVTKDKRIFVTYCSIHWFWGVMADKSVAEIREFVQIRVKPRKNLLWSFGEFDPSSFQFGRGEAIAARFVPFYRELERIIISLQKGNTTLVVEV